MGNVEREGQEGVEEGEYERLSQNKMKGNKKVKDAEMGGGEQK